MNEPRQCEAQDLRALRYLDALDAGDLEAVAALWEEANGDAELERVLAEVDQALFEEHGGRNLGMQSNRTGWKPVLRISAIGALAAACLLAYLGWSKREEKTPVPSPPQPDQQIVVRPAEETGRIAALLRARRDLEEIDLPKFDWPLPVTLPVSKTSIPPDLLE